MALPAGSEAPEFALPAAGDESDLLSLADLTAEGPALLAFFKTSCPTCQLSFPVWGELARRYGDSVRVVAIAQDPLAKAREWLDEREFEAPVLDDSDGYVVSKAYELDAVPSLVLVDTDGKVLDSSEGWHRDRANAWDANLAELAGRSSPGPLSPEDDGRPPMKPG
ncbi:MAG TPA: TlpA disulfide reductase family protein [Acidimicrobiales bacterium]|nr:TlpA disulfide reductase family protein [Acidimicrobiales bacterium]